MYFRINELELCGRVSPAAGEGTRLRLCASLDNMHFIDEATGNIRGWVREIEYPLKEGEVRLGVRARANFDLQDRVRRLKMNSLENPQ